MMLLWQRPGTCNHEHYGLTIVSYAPLSTTREEILILLQFCQAVFLSVHDWVPLGRLNEVSAVQIQH